jgi:hypothetical protein
MGGGFTLTLQQTVTKSATDKQITVSQAQEGDLLIIVQALGGWSSKNTFTMQAGTGFAWASQGTKTSAFNSTWGTTLFGQIGVSYRIVPAATTTFTNLSFSSYGPNNGTYVAFLYRPTAPLTSAAHYDVSLETVSGTPTAQTVTASNASGAGVAFGVQLSGWTGYPTVTLTGLASTQSQIAVATGFDPNFTTSRMAPFGVGGGVNVSVTGQDQGDYNQMITGYIEVE